MKYIFIDTNIFLHFQSVEKINWNKEFQLDKCTLIVAPIIINELDEKKMGNNKIAKRARKALQTIEKYLDNNSIENTSKIFIQIINDKPKSDLYDENDLNFKEQDHRLLASMIKFREDHNEENIAICTNDVGVRIGAKSFNFESIILDDKYLLPPEVDETEKEINRLRIELNRLKSKNPILALNFNDGKDYLKLKQQNCTIQPIKLFEEKNKVMKEEFPSVDLETITPDNNRRTISDLQKPSKEQIRDYNEKLENFYIEYEDSLKAQIMYDYQEQLSYIIKLSLENTGTIPAENIDIHLHFPDGFELINTSDKPNRAELPKSPKKPKSSFEIEPLNIKSLIFNPASYQTPKINIGNSGPEIKKTNSYDVNYNVKYLKHNYQNNLEELLIIFEFPEDVKSFAIEYIISAGNMTDQVTGTLNVILEK